MLDDFNLDGLRLMRIGCCDDIEVRIIETELQTIHSVCTISVGVLRNSSKRSVYLLHRIVDFFAVSINGKQLIGRIRHGAGNLAIARCSGDVRHPTVVAISRRVDLRANAILEQPEVQRGHALVVLVVTILPDLLHSKVDLLRVVRNGEQAAVCSIRRIPFIFGVIGGTKIAVNEVIQPLPEFAHRICARIIFERDGIEFLVNSYSKGGRVDVIALGCRGFLNGVGARLREGIVYLPLYDGARACVRSGKSFCCAVRLGNGKGRTSKHAAALGVTVNLLNGNFQRIVCFIFFWRVCVFDRPIARIRVSHRRLRLNRAVAIGNSFGRIISDASAVLIRRKVIHRGGPLGIILHIGRRDGGAFLACRNRSRMRAIIVCVGARNGKA